MTQRPDLDFNEKAAHLFHSWNGADIEDLVLAHIITEHDDLKTPANSIGDQ